MQTLIVMSDLYLWRQGGRVAGRDPGGRFRAALDHALTHHGGAAALVLLGDLTETGADEDYAWLRDTLSGLPMPLLPMLGNHDRRDAFGAAFPEAPRTAAGHVQGMLDLAAHRILTLDTLDTGADGAARARGRLCAARLAWLEAMLDGRASRRPLVFTHHPAAPVGIPWLDSIALADSGRLLALLARHGGHLVSGHVHRTVSGSRDGVGWTLVGSTSHRNPLDLGRDAPSPGPEAPGGYGLVLLEDDGGVAVHAVDPALDT